MRNRWTKIATITFLALLTGGLVLAQSQPASKSTAQVGDIAIVDSGEVDGVGEWVTVLRNGLKTSNQKNAFIDVSMECGSEIRTAVRSKNGKQSTASADAAVQVRVLVDNEEALPGTVTFCHQGMTLSATFQGIIDGCLTANLDGTVVLDEECVQPEELEILLREMQASSFQFLGPDLDAGVHDIEVQVRSVIYSSEDDLDSNSSVRGYIGKGSMSVQEVRMIKGEDIEL